MLKAIAIDDEPIALEVVKSLSSKVPFLDMKGYFTDAFAAIDFLKNEKIDLIFLDIKMPDINGIDWLKSIPKPPMVVFTTAYSEHAVESFELDAVDYLLKPFSLARFLKAANKVYELHRLKNITTVTPQQSYIFVKSGYEQYKVALDEILYLQSAGNYVQFILTTQKLLSRLTMNEAEALLPAASFTRIHRSYVIANSKITRMDKNSIWINDIELPIGNGYSYSAEQIAKG